MNRIWGIIRSRYFISALVILLQMAQLLLVFVLLYNNFLLMVILAYITYFGVFLYIVNEYESPEIKLPWIIILMLFPIISAFIFIVIVGSDENKKTKKRFDKIKKEIVDCFGGSDGLESLKEEDMVAYSQAHYLSRSNLLPVFHDTRVTYYEDGKKFHGALLSSLRSAKEFIMMEYFIIEEGVMWDPILEILREKANEGVEVFVIYDDFGCIATLDENYYKMLNRMGIKCMPSMKFKPVLSKFHNNRDHRKITVIDGKVGFTGGINLADEYINAYEKHGLWKDTAVKLEGNAVASLTALFLETWNTQNKMAIDASKYIRLKNNAGKRSGYVIPYGDGPSEIYEDTVGKNVYLNMINSACKYIYITTPYLICDYELLNALCLAAKKGVDVRILTPHIPDKKTVFLMTRSNYKRLIESGVSIYEFTPGFIHAKNFICDDLYATCGTINLDYRSLVHHFECGVWMYKTECIKDMREDFEKTLSVSQQVSIEGAKLKGWKKLLAEIMKIFSPLL